jgi:hypothetical protein
MRKEDVEILDHLLTTYSNEEFAATIAELCHGKANIETKNIIRCLQHEIEVRENN